MAKIQLFNEYGQYTDEGMEVSHRTRELVEPLIKELIESKQYYRYQLDHIMQSALLTALIFEDLKNMG